MVSLSQHILLYCTYSFDMLNKGMIHVPGGIEWDFIIQSGAQFRTCKLFIPEILHLIFLDHGWLWVTEAAEMETGNKRGGSYYITKRNRKTQGV